jgi:LPS-assembly lipoprotein
MTRAAAAIVVAGALGTAGCGFQPMYGPTASGANLSDVLKTVDIAPIPGRVGQRMRNELIYGVTQGSGSAPPLYRMDVIIKESVRNTLVTRAGNPTGQVYELYAEFRLVRLKDNEVVYKGASSANADYDLSGANVGTVYGDIRAGINAQNRAARTLADTLKTRVAAFLATTA